MSATKIKNNGVVYTPNYIVKMILDESNYKGDQILKKHVIDNSCGDGRFLIEIVERYIEEFFKNQRRNIINQEELKSELEEYIHGIELDEEEVLKCKMNLDDVAGKHGLENINWDVNQGDTLKVSKYDNKMDFVLGNPPYVRVHNLKENFEHIKNQKFTNTGMTDLFIIFYEIGINMLNETGKLGYITPSSIFNSVAGTEFRKFIIENKLLTSVIDLKHFQAFDNFMTYTAVLVLDKTNNRDVVEYSLFNEKKLEKYLIDYLNYKEIYLNNYFYFAKRLKLIELNEILKTNIKTTKLEIKNGFATLADGIFIKENFDFKSKFIINILKASRKKWYKAIYPYDKNSSIVNFDDLEQELQDYLIEHKERLSNRSLDKNSLWYSFGRTQGINDVWKKRLAINSLVRTKEDIKIEYLNPGDGVYSGLYIVSDYNYDIIKEMIVSKDFIDYVSLLGKYKAGGYYTFSSADLKKYVMYKLKNEGAIK